MARLKWVEDTEATGELQDLFERSRRERGRVAPIYRAFSLRPDLLKLVMDLSRRAHFEDGFLPRKTKEMIATYVSGLNRCPY